MADRRRAEVIISFDMLVYRSGPLVACHIMPDLVGVTTRDDLPAGPYRGVSEDESRAVAKALEAGADTRYRPLHSRWRSSHGNDGPMTLWPRKHGSPVPTGPDVVTRLCRTTIQWDRTDLVFNGPTPLHFRNNQPLRAMELCGETACEYRWGIPEEFAAAHYWTWADPDYDRRDWPLADDVDARPVPDRVFTIAQAAEYLGLTAKTLYNWRTQEDRDQPPSSTIEGTVVYRRSDLDEWLRRSH